MNGPRLKEVGKLAGVFLHEDAPRPLECLTEELMELVLLQTDETWEIPVWLTREDCIANKQEDVSDLVRHLRAFGNHWPDDDQLMDVLC